MTKLFPNETDEYRAARDELLESERELRRSAEAVAAARRALPPGGEVPEDYLFEDAGPDGGPAPVRMSELFEPGRDTRRLLVHVRGGAGEGVPFVHLSARAALTRRGDDRPAREPRGRRRLPDRAAAGVEGGAWLGDIRLISTAGNSYNSDYLGNTGGAPNAMLEGGGWEPGWEMPIVNVFRKDGDAIRHFWGSELLYGEPEPGQDPRHNDGIDPIWGVFDLTPEGRGTDWEPDLGY